MATRFRLHLASLAFFSAAGICVAACSSPSSDDHQGGASRGQGLTYCFGDSGFCVDADVPGFPEAGPFPSPPPWPDAGASFDAAIPSWDASFGVTYCNWQDPKYATEYQTQVWTAAVKACWLGCAATECCYDNLSCVGE